MNEVVGADGRIGAWAGIASSAADGPLWVEPGHSIEIPRMTAYGTELPKAGAALKVCYRAPSRPTA